MEFGKPIQDKFSPYKTKGYASRQASRDGTLNTLALHKLSVSVHTNNDDLNESYPQDENMHIKEEVSNLD